MKKDGALYYPVFINLHSKKCVVVGGGQVAARKVPELLRCGASIEIISPELCPELNILAEAGKITVIRRRYRFGDLRGASVVIAATNNHATNIEIVKEAGEGGILVNVVDDASISSFIVPSLLSRGDIAIAVSTSGKSPALAHKIKTRLEGEFGDEYAALVLLVNEVREEVKRRGIKVNSDDWQTALDIDLLIKLLKKKDTVQAKAILLDRLKSLQK